MNKFIYFISQLVPWKKYVLKTELSQSEVLSRMNEVTSGRALFNMSNEYEFFGVVNDDGFKVHRNLNYDRGFLRVRNSFAPVIIGKVEEKNDLTEISVKMRMALPVIAFMLFSNVMWVFGLLSFVLSLATGDVGDGEIMVVLALIFGLAVAASQMCFRLPASKAAERLENIMTRR